MILVGADPRVRPIVSKAKRRADTGVRPYISTTEVIVILRSGPFPPFDAVVAQKVPNWSAKAFAHNLCVNERCCRSTNSRAFQSHGHPARLQEPDQPRAGAGGVGTGALHLIQRAVRR